MDARYDRFTVAAVDEIHTSGPLAAQGPNRTTGSRSDNTAILVAQLLSGLEGSCTWESLQKRH